MSEAAASGSPGRAAQRLRLDAGLVSMALFGANALSYLLNVVAARALAPDLYGTLASLMAVVVVGAVPAMGMQAVAALHVAGLRAANGDVAAGERALLRTAIGGAVVVGLVALAAAPAMVALLHLPTAWPMVWLALALAPLTALGGFHGTLQGRQRFDQLALLVAVEGLTKVGGGLVGLVLLRSTSATIAGIAIGSMVAATVGWYVCGHRRPAGTATAGLAGRVLHATQAILGLVLLVNLDIVLARHNLPGAQAGDYAIGAIITKIAYWLPQAVAILVLPRFAEQPRRGRMVLVALVVIAALDVWVVLVTAVWGTEVVRLIGGAEYGAYLPAVWLFALLGSLLALVQLLLYSRIASSDRRSTTAVWAAVAVEVVLVTWWLDGSGTAVASAALVSAGLLVLAGVAIEGRSAYHFAQRPAERLPVP